jgi:hypothetical protein
MTTVTTTLAHLIATRARLRTQVVQAQPLAILNSSSGCHYNCTSRCSGPDSARRHQPGGRARERLRAACKQLRAAAWTG